MEKYNVIGMSCAACSARVQKAVSALNGVGECNVNLLTNSMTVDGDVPSETVIAAVRAVGYDAVLASEDVYTRKKRLPGKTVKRLVLSALILLVLMYLSMGKMLSLPMPKLLENGMTSGIFQLALALSVALINKKFFVNGVKGVINLAPNMDTLVALGAFASFAYSTVLLFTGNYSRLYFETSAMILTFISIGKLLEEYSKGKTTDALDGIAELKPLTATVIKDGKELAVNIDELSVGDVFVVRPGESIAADGVVINGESSINESMLTGESMPVYKEKGSKVYTATVNISGTVECRAEHTGEDTAFNRILKAALDSSSSKAPIARVADKAAAIFVPTVLLISLITFAVWMLAKESFAFALSRAISVLVVSCPCALGLATPVAIMVGSGVLFKNGILFKNAAAIEKAGKVKLAVFDKTGTLTSGKLSVTDVIPVNAEYTEALTLAYSLEKLSEHPLAKAICETAEKEGIKALELKHFAACSGNGVSAEYEGKKLVGGSYGFAVKYAKADGRCEELAKRISAEGKTPVLFAYGESIFAIFGLSDTVKDDAAVSIAKMEKIGIKTYMLTGDNELTAACVAEKIGIKNVKAAVLPENKAKFISELAEKDAVAMIGDGINDAPALSAADVGMAIGTGTDIAIDAACAVLMKNDISDVYTAFAVSRAILRNIKENLFWAFFYNAICIPIAAGVLYKPFGIVFEPMMGAAAMSLSSFFVIMNALRLNLIKAEKGEEKMETLVLNVKGMMCSHCEAAVKNALEALPQVKLATADHTSGTVKVELSEKVDSELLKKVIREKGYEA